VGPSLSSSSSSSSPEDTSSRSRIACELTCGGGAPTGGGGRWPGGSPIQPHDDGCEGDSILMKHTGASHLAVERAPAGPQKDHSGAGVVKEECQDPWPHSHLGQNKPKTSSSGDILEEGARGLVNLWLGAEVCPEARRAVLGTVWALACSLPLLQAVSDPASCPSSLTVYAANAYTHLVAIEIGRWRGSRRRRWCRRRPWL
jgi:hypothetical protein